MQAIRHVIKPTISFNYIPALKGLSTDMYRQVQVDTAGRMNEYSVFEGNIFGTPSLSRRSSGISFSLVNIVEAKVFARNDTTGKPKKIKIIDNLGITTSYNVFADSMRWSPVAMVMRTTLFNNLGISANSNFSLYGLNSQGQTISKFAYAQNKKLMRLTNFSVSLDFNLSELLRGDKNKQNTGIPQEGAGQFTSGVNRKGGASNITNGTQENVLRDEYGYSVFNMPWSMNVSYNLNYSKPAFKSVVTQALSINGNVSLTKKTAITYTTGYDFTGKEITMTQIGISRDLHCWEMSFNWVPNGSMKMWNFTIRVKAAVLSDLKYERRKDYHDDYY